MLGMLSDDSESELLSVLAEDAELFELAELSDLCNCVGFATGLLVTADFCLISFIFALAGGFFEHFVELLVDFIALTLAVALSSLSLSLLFSGLNMLFFFNLFCTGSDVFPDFSGAFPLALVVPENLLGLLLIGFEAGAALCCPDAGANFAGSLCVLTTGATVAVAFGLAGGFLFCGDFALLGDSSDSEEYTIGLGFGGCLSLFFSRGCTGTVSALDLT